MHGTAPLIVWVPTVSNTVEIRADLYNDNSIADALNAFFAPLVVPRVWNSGVRAAKALDAIEIAISITASWAAVRFLLDPLAKRTDEWIKGVVELWQNSKPKRPIRITMRFKQQADTLDVEVSGTTDEVVLKRIWTNIQTVVEVRIDAKEQGTVLDKIQIIPDGSHGLLVVAYEGSRPQYTINLANGNLSSIPAHEQQAAEKRLRLIGALVRSLETRRMLVGHGHTVSEVQVAALVRSIEEEKVKLLPHT